MNGAAEVFPQAVADASVFTALSGSASWSRVVLQGTSVMLNYELDHAEVERRQRIGLGAITSPDALRILMSLSLGAPKRTGGDPLCLLPPGTVEVERGCVIRLAVPPVEAVSTVVPARSWRLGLERAGRFAPFCSRAMMLPAMPRDLDVLRMEADFYGIGVIVGGDDAPKVVVPPAPFRRRRLTAAGWLFLEEAYRQLA
ncbi:hypothetical protein [Streptosporangium sp. NPDC048865]|uniref:hypothetical protein n=1 Tax=Streptosporangium sp. NPDC048865 TaxID=3155766 RepID=UPI0034428AD2